MATLVCPLCPRERTSGLKLNITRYLQHIQLFHSHQPGFRITCGLDGCARTFKNFITFRCHISARHRNDPEQTNDVNLTNLEEGGNHDHSTAGNLSDDNDDSESPSDGTEQRDFDTMSALQTSSALFIMKLKEEHKLTQTAIQGIVEGVTSLTQNRLSLLCSEVSKKLGEAGVEIASIPGLNDLFDVDGVFGCPFSGLETQHQQHKYFVTHFNFVVH